MAMCQAKFPVALLQPFYRLKMLRTKPSVNKFQNLILAAGIAQPWALVALLVQLQDLARMWKKRE